MKAHQSLKINNRLNFNILSTIRPILDIKMLLDTPKTLSQSDLATNIQGQFSAPLVNVQGQIS